MIWQWSHRIREAKTKWGSVSCLASNSIDSFRSYASGSNLIYLFAGYGNTGDHASFLGVRRLVGKAGQIRPLETIDKDHFRGTSGDTHLIVGGGGLLQPVFESAWNTIVESGLSFSVLGIGLAESPPHRPQFDRRLLARIADQCTLATMRDHATADAFRSVGGTCTTAFCTSILELSTVPRPTDQDRDTLLHVCHPSDLRLTNCDLAAIRGSAMRAAKRLNLRYVEIDHRQPFSHRVIKKYDRAAICISSRLHGCIFAYCRGVPCVPLVCDRKTPEFYGTYTDYTSIPIDDQIKRLDQLSIHDGCAPATTEQLQNLKSELLNIQVPLAGHLAL